MNNREQASPDAEQPQKRHSRHRRTLRLWTVCGLIAGAIAIGTGATGTGVQQAQAQIAPGTPVIFAGDLNGDSYADTVIGRNYGAAMTLLPEAVVWGWDWSQQPPPGFIPVTPFVYPAYPEFAGSAAFLHVNPEQDDLTDMILFVWGTTDSSSAEADTGRTVVIFGQSVLSEQHSIDLNLLPDSVQTSPYYAQDLYINQHLTEPSVRDLSGVDSYLLPDIDMGGHTEPPKPVMPKPVITQVGSTTVGGATLRIYPNPSLHAATLEAELPAGSYTLRIVGVSGRVLQQQSLELARTGSIRHTLDLSDLASGYYMVQIERSGTERSGENVGAYPFIIRR